MHRRIVKLRRRILTWAVRHGYHQKRAVYTHVHGFPPGGTR